MLGFLLRAVPERIEGLYWAYVYGGCSSGRSNERNGSTFLRTIVAAQYDYRDNDRDGNQTKDFWRADVAGLYTEHLACDPAEPAMKLIELSIAAADERPVSDVSPYAVKSAKAGYWYRALLHEEETVPSPDRFAVCAFPDTRSAGEYTFIVDEQNFIYRKKLKTPRGVDRFPRDPIKEGWARID
jgi:hypothetical protein